MNGLPRLITVLGACVALAACTGPAAPTSAPATAAGATTSASPPTSARPSIAPSTSTPASSPTTTAAAPRPRASQPSTGSGPAPTAYRTAVVHHGADHPDDLVLDASGRLLYSDYTNGTISRLDPGGTATVIHRGLDGPEGMVLLADGTLVVAEENTNRVLAYASGASSPHVLTALPGTPVKVTCHEGVDGIAWDAGTHTLVVPDPVTGTIYRMQPDGSGRTRLSSGFAHPVGAAVGPDGAVYVADECGGDVWRLGAGGSHTRVARASMPDDVVLDGHGNLLVTDVRHVNHDVRRWSLSGGASTVLARSGLVEPQGLLVDAAGRIYVSDDKSNVILRLTPVA
ncbi:SMP-30/gluconolactonase/LRE family protein [Terrabacter carboxydivorans]